MKLFPKIFTGMALSLIIIMGVWAYWFYRTMMSEINDETDASLSDYSEQLISRSLANEELPLTYKGTNNEYYFRQVPKSYADTHPHIRFEDKIVYINAMRETEPARVMHTIFYAGNGQYRQLTVYTPTIEKLDVQHAILFWIVVLYLSLTLILLVVIYVSIKGHLKPLYRLLEWIGAYRLDNRCQLPPYGKGVSEFEQLYAALRMFVNRNEEIYEKQKLFIGNASHEIQTPLAIAMNRIEMLMNEDMEEEQLVELDKVYRTLHRLGKLNKELLLLCRVENGQFTDIADVCFNDVFRQLAADYEEVFSYKNIQREVIDEGDFKVSFSANLASALIAIMVKNAYVHTPTGGRISIRFTEEGVDFCNSGAHALDAERIFEYFYHNHDMEGSVGIGLPLGQSICRYGKLSMTYHFEKNQHIFSIRRR